VQLGGNILGRPAVFVDRDGTINEQMGYINHPSRFVILPGVPEAIGLLNRSDYLVIVVSNQSGVARGYFPIDLVHEVHDLLNTTLSEKDCAVDGIFFCPHHTLGIIPEYRRECDCRKPKTGLVEQARKAFDIDMSNSYVVGDRYLDIELAFRLNLKGILVETGYGRGEIKHILPGKQQPTYIAKDLLHAAKWIVKGS
jgi:D-glycero-D-manno-heptose 1,7-bisphosphate phosphatase